MGSRCGGVRGGRAAHLGGQEASAQGEARHEDLIGGRAAHLCPVQAWASCRHRRDVAFQWLLSASRPRLAMICAMWQATDDKWPALLGVLLLPLRAICFPQTARLGLACLLAAVTAERSTAT